MSIQRAKKPAHGLIVYEVKHYYNSNKVVRIYLRPQLKTCLIKNKEL